MPPEDIDITEHIRSNDVQEIISQVPSWLVRWGTSVIFLVLMSIIYLSWFIKYPDIVKAEVIISSNPSPINLVTRNNGYLKILINETEKVIPGEIIAYIETSTNVNDLLLLEEQIKLCNDIRILKLSTIYQLGILQTIFNGYLAAQYKLELYYNNNPQKFRTNELKIDDIKIFTERQLVIKKEIQLQTLISEINKWKVDNLLISPLEGIVAKIGLVENGQFVNEGKEIFSIIPDAGEIFGNALIPIERSSKVKQAQKANIKLFNYPSEEFGMLYGVVESISIIPYDGYYLVKISMPNGMKSTYNEDFTFKQDLRGEVEIITEDMRLIDRIFYQIRKLIDY